MGQITVHPLAEWGGLDTYRWPDPDDPKFFYGLEERAEAIPDEYYITTSIFMLLFERLHGLRGFENMMADLYLERENLEKLADRIVDFDIRIIENIASRCPGKIDGFSFTDDWGSEQALLIDPKMWREFFKPRYKKIFDAIRKAGWHVWMHSCGKVNDILGDLIDIGCQVVNLQQPRLLGIEEVGKQFAGRICFEALCDIQHTLPFKDAEDIEKEAKLLLDFWGTDTGGFIFSDYGDDVAINATPEKKRAMFDAFMKYDRWRATM
jgi:uroporphyrinogen-III decarboxylase